MTTLLNILKESIELDDLIADYALSDQDSEEITLDLIQKHQEIDEAFKDKLSNYKKIIKKLERESEAKKEQAKKLNQQAKNLDNQVEFLKRQILNALEIKEIGINKPFKVQDGSFKISTNKRIVIDCNVNDLPERFKRIQVSEDKLALKQALEDGETLDYARFEVTKSLRIG